MANSDPRIIKSTALAKATQLESRVNALVTSAATDISPVTVYLEGSEVLVSANGTATAGGSWTCPAGVYGMQVECYGAGGGGGGGTTTYGGGGGGGGEYACEPSYAVLPGNVYTYAVGLPGQGGICGSGNGGWAGGNTQFDLSGTGVLANGGLGGDSGVVNNGGTGSTNSVHFDGGSGGISSAGMASDDPSTQVNPLMWWRMDDNPPSGGTAISRTGDSAGSNYYGTVVTTGSGSSGTPLPPAPLQVPTRTTSTVNSETFGNAFYFKQHNASALTYISASRLKIGSSQPAPRNGAALSVSCWVRGDQALGTWGMVPSHGFQYSTLIGNCNYIGGLDTGFTESDSAGFALFLKSGIGSNTPSPVFYLNNLTSSWHLTVTGSALPVPDGTWHQIVATWDGQNAKIYQDGALVSTSSLGSSGNKIAPGPKSLAVGVKPDTLSDSAFTGTMSNLWVTGSAVNSTFVSVAYGATPATGGSGGGASGGSAGTGLAGTSAASSTGTAGGSAASAATSITNGSAAGGTGGNLHANGSAPVVAVPYAGGGGGAGSGTSLSTVSSLTLTAQHSASYTGLDATGGNNGSMYNSSESPQAGIVNPSPGVTTASSNMYAGGDPSSGFNGSLNSVAVMPYAASTLSNKNVNSVRITLTIQSTNSSVLPVFFGTGTDIPSALGSDADIAAYLGTLTALVRIAIPEGSAGRQVTFDITNSSLITALKTSTVVLVFGGLQGSGTYDIGDGAWSNPDSYAWNTVITGAGATDATTNLYLTLEVWPNSGSNTAGGDGGAGYIVLSFIDTRYWPVVSIQPSATADDNGNSLAEGITADFLTGFDQTVGTVPRAPETWHPLGSLQAGSNITIDTARWRYSPEDGGTLVIQVSGHVGGSAVVSGGYNFANTLQINLRPTVSSTSANDTVNIPWYWSNATPGGVLRILGKNASGAGQVSIQIPSAYAGTTNQVFYAWLRIPLT